VVHLDDDQPLNCADCGRQPRSYENAEDEWRTYYEGVGDEVTSAPSVRSSSVRAYSPTPARLYAQSAEFTVLATLRCLSSSHRLPIGVASECSQHVTFAGPAPT
jgi:hypothetical protein